MKRILIASVVTIAVLGATFTSCKKEKPDTDTQSAVDNSICETEFSKTMSSVNGFAIKENGIKSMMDAASVMSGQPTITVDPADTLDGFPVTMTIDYGTATTPTVDGVDGKTRSGQIICVFSNYWHIVGAYVKVNLVNFKVDGKTYACDSMRISHSAANAFSHQVYNGKYIDGGTTIQWSGIHTITQTGGASTPLNFLDDVYSLTGNANGVSRNAVAFTVNISSPVVKRTSCHWIESGRVDITPEGLAVRTLDYGDGTCDNKASITINGNTFSFTMD
jgi:hypothetical protein